nr:MAG TPA: hypothetical protein [Bacteriophage sp.]
MISYSKFSPFIRSFISFTINNSSVRLREII